MLFYNIVCIFQMDFFSKSKRGKTLTRALTEVMRNVLIFVLHNEASPWIQFLALCPDAFFSILTFFSFLFCMSILIIQKESKL